MVSHVQKKIIKKIDVVNLSLLNKPLTKTDTNKKRALKFKRELEGTLLNTDEVTLLSVKG